MTPRSNLRQAKRPRRTRLQRLDSTQLVDKLTALRARRSRLTLTDVNERRHLRRAEQRVLAELETRTAA